jgi:hypothetical protein
MVAVGCSNGQLELYRYACMNGSLHMCLHVCVCACACVHL